VPYNARYGVYRGYLGGNFHEKKYFLPLLNGHGKPHILRCRAPIKQINSRD
jgi:hypothetical protein